ncbi:type IV conjugative transfer system protein TraL [Legionella pneumophila]|uniref:type IV conjugative transfer system protein TraL n=1 Tax=Legionella pneumophila TaxID=446 RepID=UPI0010A9AFBE|nr:type IV conjugative transfer system protein TraL [Legionella pneumophila]TIG73096.1 type IV conjugative transfer system protein TraL [Legionella pneumophila]HAT8803705.1 type IV conjugative transfer system protein TraL [Legionella pneumophila]HAU1990756.1 type IV conjugative transfer system protein TraL [Legionella pneumophila]HAU2197750.1 type IV conjugative transfer system protein TraL [Legionella pneumophila]
MNYQFLNHIDAPKRVLTLTLDELCVAVLGLMLLVLSNQKIGVSLLGLGSLSGLRYLKKGEGPKALLVLAYWSLPSMVTQFFLPKLPLSHHRVYVA